MALWCACCENNPVNILKVSKVYYKYTGYETYYQVVIEGVGSSGVQDVFEVDLAYVHYKVGEKAYNVGLALGFECKP